jgi:branched-chain amino acid transport system substrate-binding protein
MVAALIIGGCGPKGADIVTHTIVSLVPLTGVLSTYGENSKKATELAAEDVNAWLEAEGKGWRLNLVADDTGTDGPTALSKMQTWFGNGVKFFSGPQASGEAMACLEFANSNKILFVSQSSTSPALAIADDWLFRFCTTDALQGPAIARVAAEAGVKHLIFSWRGDTWGDGLQSASAAAAGKLNIQIYPQALRYDPLLEEFTKEAALLDGYVKDLVGKGVPLKEIGFCIIAFEEIAPFMVAADAYPQLREIVWIGSDGTVKSEALISSAVASKFAADTKFISSMNRPEAFVATSKHEHVKNSLTERLGREPDAYAFNAYDIIWALALAIDEVGYDSEKVRAILPRVADEWSKQYGASGHVVLNAAGDRAFADYDLWLINDKIEWEFVGYYESPKDKINWQRKVY